MEKDVGFVLGKEKQGRRLAPNIGGADVVTAEGAATSDGHAPCQGGSQVGRSQPSVAAAMTGRAFQAQRGGDLLVLAIPSLWAWKALPVICAWKDRLLLIAAGCGPALAHRDERRTASQGVEKELIGSIAM